MKGIVKLTRNRALVRTAKGCGIIHSDVLQGAQVSDLHFMVGKSDACANVRHLAALSSALIMSLSGLFGV